MRRLGLGFILAALSAVIFAACASDPEIVEVEKVVEVVKEVQVPVEIEGPVEVERTEIVEVEKVVTVEVETVRGLRRSGRSRSRSRGSRSRPSSRLPLPHPRRLVRLGLAAPFGLSPRASIATLDSVWSPFYVVVAVWSASL